MRDAGNVKRRIRIGQTVDAGVIAERPFGAQVGIVNVAFEHEFGAGRHFQIDGARLDQFNRFAAQESGERELIQHRRQRCSRSIRQDRIAADRNRDRNFITPCIGVRASLLVALPMHTGLALVINLHAIHADVGPSAARIVGDHQR